MWAFFYSRKNVDQDVMLENEYLQKFKTVLKEKEYSNTLTWYNIYVYLFTYKLTDLFSQAPDVTRAGYNTDVCWTAFSFQIKNLDSTKDRTCLIRNVKWASNELQVVYLAWYELFLKRPMDRLGNTKFII